MDENQKPRDFPIATTGPRVVVGTFGVAFAGIGLSVLAFLWLTPFNQFGAPPLFFRVFGSFIALCFVAMGGTTFLGAIYGGRFSRLPTPPSFGGQRNPQRAEPGVGLNYTCPNCGANLGAQVNVSPLGDVNCPFCHQWYNIHQTRADG